MKRVCVFVCGQKGLMRTDDETHTKADGFTVPLVSLVRGTSASMYYGNVFPSFTYLG